MAGNRTATATAACRVVVTGALALVAALCAASARPAAPVLRVGFEAVDSPPPPAPARPAKVDTPPPIVPVSKAAAPVRPVQAEVASPPVSDTSGLFGPLPGDASPFAPLPPPIIPLTGLRPTPGLTVGGCASCGGGYGSFLGGDSCGCPDGPCIPGQEPCSPNVGKHFWDRFLYELYHCICCPDPCYQPKWIGLANAAYFVDGVRPVTQQRGRLDCGFRMVFPDRSEYFWARADGMGLGPSPPAPFRAIPSLDYSEMSIYTEGATGGFSIWTSIPYRSIDPELIGHLAGFGDISIGTKSLLFDCELIQIGLQMTTTLPSGNFFKGLGNGLVSLEPALLVGIRISEDTYFQGQLAEWIPIGGDLFYEGAILKYSVSLNQVVARPANNVQLIGTVEFMGYSFQDGAYTDPVVGSFQKSSGESYLSLGPGCRLVVCDKIDFGVGAMFSITQDNFAQQLIRSEFRVRY